MRIPPEPDIPPQINIVPMIDVIFAILTFFIMSTLFLSRTEGLPTNLPKAATGKAQEQTKIVVSISNKGEVALNKKNIQLEQLEPQIKQLIGQNTESVVIINADEKVNHGRVVSVMDKIRQVEGAKLAIATERP
jgi:biopolymer transport protein ExbD